MIGEFIWISLKELEFSLNQLTVMCTTRSERRLFGYLTPQEMCEKQIRHFLQIGV